MTGTLHNSAAIIDALTVGAMLGSDLYAASSPREADALLRHVRGAKDAERDACTARRLRREQRWAGVAT